MLRKAGAASVGVAACVRCKDSWVWKARDAVHVRPLVAEATLMLAELVALAVHKAPQRAVVAVGLRWRLRFSVVSSFA